MTKEQLDKGNKLSARISGLENSEDKISKCIKEIDLTNYGSSHTSIRVDSMECVINKERVTAFLWSELKIIKKEITTDKLELRNL